MVPGVFPVELGVRGSIGASLPVIDAVRVHRLKPLAGALVFDRFTTSSAYTHIPPVGIM